jgi:hypothetical protein
MNKKELIELNSKAREMLREGNFEGIRALASGKGITNRAIDDFILGESLTLEESREDELKKVSEETANVEVIVPFYKSIEEKLEQEQELLLKDIKEETEKTFIKNQLKAIVDFILADEDLKAKAFQNWKELSRCYKALTENAKKYAISGVACINDATVFGWIRDYYNLDDRKKIEKERLDEAIAKKKAEDAKKQAAEKPKKTRKTKAKPKKETEKPKSKDDEKDSEQQEFVIDESLVSSNNNVETVNASDN